MTTVTLRLPANLEELPAAQDFLARQAELGGLDPRTSGRLALALEEVFVNVCHYAYPAGTPGEIELRATRDPGRFLLDVIDDGVEVDPQGIQEPDLDLPLERRAVGGLGWFMIRRLVSELHCRRERGRNRVSLVMDLPADASASAGG
ncbi:ATP-binding protein [Imhoffiella purpurea]|uniref:Serine-protein kinase RsbW n=1 Tax=Imhoffiella purpurea TaxID=1249627 RepID=W9VF90_9GAMM|nr:ATP-binding protein [Imhoffiella purpurea]EXJ15671.1 Serine-protein kinase RsbW [Imhoffiella purpurea]